MDKPMMSPVFTCLLSILGVVLLRCPGSGPWPPISWLRAMARTRLWSCRTGLVKLGWILNLTFHRVLEEVAWCLNVWYYILQPLCWYLRRRMASRFLGSVVGSVCYRKRCSKFKTFVQLWWGCEPVIRAHLILSTSVVLHQNQNVIT